MTVRVRSSREDDPPLTDLNHGQVKVWIRTSSGGPFVHRKRAYEHEVTLNGPTDTPKTELQTLLTWIVANVLTPNASPPVRLPTMFSSERSALMRVRIPENV